MNWFMKTCAPAEKYVPHFFFLIHNSVRSTSANIDIPWSHTKATMQVCGSEKKNEASGDETAHPGVKQCLRVKKNLSLVQY